MAKNSAYFALFAVLVLLNRRARRDRKGFRNSFHTCLIPHYFLRVLGVLRGSISLTAELAEDAKIFCKDYLLNFPHYSPRS